MINDYKLIFDKFSAVKFGIYSHQNDTLELYINEKTVPLALYYSLKYCNLFSFFRFLEYKISIPKSFFTTSINNCKLKNLGNTCYFNSLMLKEILDIQNFTENTTVALHSLKSIFDELFKKKTFIISKEIIKTFNIFSSDEINKQNDASESLIKIMSAFPQQIKALYKFALSDEYTQKVSFQSMLDLSLYDPDLHLLDELIDNNISFLYFPQYLIITLKRFRYDPLSGTEKIYHAVFPNMLLDLSKNSCYENVKAYYKRNSMIIHSGNATKGHYYTFVTDQSTDEVKKFNDEEIIIMNKDYLLSEEVLKNIYLLLYVLIPEDEFLENKNKNENEISSFKNMNLDEASETNSSSGNDSYLDDDFHDVALDEDINTLETNANFSEESTFLNQEHMTQLQHQITNDNHNLSTQNILLDLRNILNNNNQESVIDTLKDYINGMLTIHETDIISEEVNDILYPCNKNDYIIYEIVGEYSAKLLQFKSMPDDGIITIPETLTHDCNEIRIIDAENDLFNDFEWKKVIIYNPDIIKKNILRSLKSETLILKELKEIELYGDRISNFDILQKAETITKDKNNILYYGKLLLFGPKNLKDIEISDITVVGKNSFSISSSNLRSIKFPDSVELIEKNAFENCKNLCLICFSTNSNMRKIKKRAFYSCCSLQEFTAPRDLISIGKSCFEKCKLKIINLNQKLLKISSSAFAHNSINNIKIPESVIEIRDDAFKSNKIFRVEMSNRSKVTNIASSAFDDNKILILDMPNRFKKLIVSSFSTYQLNLVPFDYNIHQKTMEKQKIINKISKIAVLNSEGVRYREKNNDLYFTCSNKGCSFKIICYRKDIESDAYICIQYGNHDNNCHVSCPRPLKAHLDDVLKSFFPKCEINNFIAFLPNISQLCGGCVSERRIKARLNKLKDESFNQSSWKRLPSLISLIINSGGKGFIYYEPGKTIIKYVGIVPDYSSIYLGSSIDFGVYMADGTFLSRGVIIIFSAITGNHDSLPIGWVWAPTEEKKPIILLLEQLKDFFNISKKTFIIDESMSFKAAITEVVNNIFIQNCSFHIFEKFPYIVKSKLHNLIQIDNVELFNSSLNIFKQEHPEAFKKIEKKMPHIFNFCSGAKKMGLTTTALQESLNARLRLHKLKEPFFIFEKLYAIGKDIINKMVNTQETYTLWFSRRIKYTIDKANSGELGIEPLATTIYKIQDKKKRTSYTVSFSIPNTYTCTCLKGLKRGFPCSHVLAVINGFATIGRTWKLTGLIHKCYQAQEIRSIMLKTLDKLINFSDATPEASVMPYKIKASKRIKRSKSIKEIKRKQKLNKIKKRAT